MNMNITVVNTKSITKEEAAKMIGLKTYDTALPQQWLDKVVKESGVSYDDILSNIVWSYDDAHIFGSPCPLTVKGCAVLQKIDSKYFDPKRIYNVLQINYWRTYD